MFEHVDLVLVAIGLLLGWATVMAWKWRPKGDQPQTVVLKTVKTRYQILWDDLKGLVKIVFWAILIGTAIGLYLTR